MHPVLHRKVLLLMGIPRQLLMQTNVLIVELSYIAAQLEFKILKSGMEDQRFV